MRLNPRFELTGGEADEAGKFESLTLRSPQDYAAMDISYVSGEEVSEQVDELQRELKGNVDAADRPKFTQLSKCDAKFDILHFEQVSAEEDGDDDSEMLDPSAPIERDGRAHRTDARRGHRPTIRQPDVNAPSPSGRGSG